MNAFFVPADRQADLHHERHGDAAGASGPTSVGTYQGFVHFSGERFPEHAFDVASFGIAKTQLRKGRRGKAPPA